MNLSNVDDVDSAELSPDTDPKPKRRPRWQIELEAHNGVPTNPSSRSRRNSRNSTLAKEDSVALTAVAAVSTTPIAKENGNKIAQRNYAASTTTTSLTSINKNESNAVCRTSTSTASATSTFTISTKKDEGKIVRRTSTSSAASSSKTVHHTSATPTTSFVPIKKEKKKKDIDKNKIIPAKKTSHVKHKKTYSTIATTSVVAAIPQIVPSTSTAPSSAGQNIQNVTSVVAAVPKITPASTAPSSAGQNIKKVDTVETMEMKKKKGRIRKPRRIIPKDKEYIPVDEQPAPADVVGGRGGRSNHHPGNRPYWHLILENRTRYKNCRSDHDKAHIANEILMCVRQSYGGRFLNIDSANKRWFALPDAVVLDKIKQALRDKYVPFWAKNSNESVKSNGTALTRKAMGNQRHVSNPTGAAMATVNINATNLANPNNNLDFLLNSPANRHGHTAVVPSVEDILKVKVDQVPTFGDATTNGHFPSRSSFGLNAYQSMFPNAWMASLGMGMGMPMPMGGIQGAVGGGTTAVNNVEMSHGFGFGGNPGAPALPTAAMGGFSPSIGLLQSMDMKSLDNYMEQQVAAMTTAGIPSTSAVAAQFANAQSQAAMGANINPVAARQSPGHTESSAVSSTGSTKTDWDAMYAKALSNAKPV
eukprot:CAMPEP_0170789678 /NCGR_PEP_ID=MMETSP0733-20121128/19890_1 /TAXON_ID=186038 /ORGANISM="Fragilariopsis kerguelensis, Strain L26-C5" /LENGTH=645 /DNA_ID=CAMNT_0011136859 /DNA_START=55 /DNA_END=1992 /DNA_ORIENTATION=+